MPPCLQQDLRASGSPFLLTNSSEDDHDEIASNTCVNVEEDVGIKNSLIYSVPVSGVSLPVQVIILEQLDDHPLFDNSTSFMKKNNDHPNNIDEKSLRTSHKIPQLDVGKSIEISQLAGSKSLVPSNEIPQLATIPSSSSLLDFTHAMPNPEASLLELEQVVLEKSSQGSLGCLKRKISDAERCKIYRAKTKKKLKKEETELEQLEEKNKLLKSQENGLMSRIDTLRESYLFAVRNGHFKCPQRM